MAAREPEIDTSAAKAGLRDIFTGAARRYDAGTRVFWSGEPARRLYFLSTGLIKMSDIDPDGDEIIVRLHRAGDIFGERCFLRSFQQHSATAVEDSEVLEIPTGLLLERVQGRPDTLLELLGRLSGRLAEADGERQASISEPVVVRLAKKLLALGEASRLEGDWAALPDGFRHTELAQLVGVQRETVTRALARLRGLGLVAAGRGPIRIHRLGTRRFLGREGRRS